jgi:glutamate/tyrosine decarboxylase-like PLP-dependent enzyme
VLGPAAAVVEEVAGVSVGFVTGAQMANVTGLAVALQEVLRRAGWYLAADGLWGAPRVRVLAGQGRHGTIDRALRFLGVGTATVVAVDADDQGRMRVEALAAALEQGSGPAIVCAQVGNVNSGAVDPLPEIVATAHDHGAWLHVDGAFGLWAAASPRLRPLVAGVELADSWATDAHKWLNVPYDSGLIFCAHPEAHRAAMGMRAGYLVHGSGGERDALDCTPSTPGGPAGSPSMRPSGPSAARAWPSWSSAAAGWPTPWSTPATTRRPRRPTTRRSASAPPTPSAPSPSSAWPA